MAGTTRQRVINTALRELGQSPETQAVDTRATKACDAVYEESVNEALSHNWQWASTTVDLIAKETGRSPLRPDWVVYEPPANAHKVAKVHEWGFSDPMEFTLNADGLHAYPGGRLAATVVMRLRERDWPPHFANLVSLTVADKVSRVFDSKNSEEIRMRLLNALSAANVADVEQRSPNKLFARTFMDDFAYPGERDPASMHSDVHAGYGYPGVTDGQE